MRMVVKTVTVVHHSCKNFSDSTVHTVNAVYVEIKEPVSCGITEVLSTYSRRLHRD